MRLRFVGLLAVGLLVVLGAPLLAASATLLAPKMPMSLDVAPLPRTFFMHSVDLDYTGGRVILASTPDGAGTLHTNDELQMAVVHDDGTASWYRHDYAGSPENAPGETPPVDITSLLRSGRNRLEIRMLDLYGSKFGAKDYYLVSFAPSEAAPKADPAPPYTPDVEAFIYAETPVFAQSSPGPIDLCVVSPGGGEQAVINLDLRGLAVPPAPLPLTLRAGFNRRPVPLEDLRADSGLIGGTVKIGDRTLKIASHPIYRISPPFAESEIVGILSDLSARVKSDQAQIAARQNVRAAAADALVTRSVMERVRRSPALATESKPDPSDVKTRARLLLACSRLVESGAMGTSIADELDILRGQYLDWGRLRYAKMAAAPGRLRYERGQEEQMGSYHNLTVYWANLPIAAVRRVVYDQSRKMEPMSVWPEVKGSQTREITLAGRSVALFPEKDGHAETFARTSQFSLDIDAPSESAAIGLMAMALKNEPVTPRVVDSILADLRPPVAVRGLRGLMRAVGASGELLSMLKRSAALAADGRFAEARSALDGTPAAAVVDCNSLHTLYALGTRNVPNRAPILPAGRAAIVCWSEGPGRTYVLVRYDGPAARREAALTLVALLDLLPGRQMLVGDVHQHSNISDGMGEPQEMFFQTVSHFTDFHALTDHNTIRGAEAIAKELPSWGLRYPFLIGEEVTTDFAHIPAIGPNGEVSPKGEPMEVLKRIHDSGAVAILAHPWSTSFQDVFRRDPFARREMTAFQYNPAWYAAWKRNGAIPPMVEVTDTHDMSLAWPYRAIVFPNEVTPAGIKQALFDGDCCAWTPGGPRGSERVTRVVWALMSDRQYYEGQQLRRLAQRVMELNTEVERAPSSR